MKWVRYVVNDIDKFADDYNKLIKSGNGDLEAVRCVFQLKETSIPAILTIFDFLDYYNDHIITKDSIEKLYFYQLQ